MADKVYVEIASASVKSIFDPKHKARVVTLMEATAKKAIKGNLTTSKAAVGWSCLPNLVSLELSGKKLTAQLSMIVATLPGKAIKATTKGSASTEVKDPAKVDPGDVDAIVEAAVEGAMKAAVPFMEKTKPE